VRTANNAATGGLEADLVVYLDIAPEKGLARKHGEPEAIRTGLEDLDFHRRVREGYLLQARSSANSWTVIDAGLPPGRVAELALDAVHATLRAR